jgi:hypothetical protein
MPVLNHYGILFTIECKLEEFLGQDQDELAQLERKKHPDPNEL